VTVLRVGGLEDIWRVRSACLVRNIELALRALISFPVKMPSGNDFKSDAAPACCALRP
jgi:hypothetical protein